MAEDENNESEKFDFAPDGEGYISLAEARVLAMQTAVASPGDYGSQYQGVVMVFEVVESSEDDDYYTDGYWSRGWAYIKIGQFLLALTDFNKAIQIDPNEADLYSNRGYIYLRLEQHQNAINDYTKVIELDPDFAMAYYNRAFDYRDLGQWSLAAADEIKACSLDKGYCNY